MGAHTLFMVSPKGTPYNIVEKNLEYRKLIKIPKEYIALSEPEVSFVILKINKSRAIPAKVFIIDPLDCERLFMGQALEFPCQEFDSFTDFFEYLIEEAEKKCEYQRQETSYKHNKSEL